MTTEEQVRALAELGGFTNICIAYPESELVGTKNGKRTIVPFYLTSYDAIIPLIRKLPLENAGSFWGELNKLTDFFEEEGHTGVFRATPPQLCEALLRSAGKWKD